MRVGEQPLLDHRRRHRPRPPTTTVAGVGVGVAGGRGSRRRGGHRQADRRAPPRRGFRGLLRGVRRPAAGRGRVACWTGARGRGRARTVAPPPARTPRAPWRAARGQPDRLRDRIRRRDRPEIRVRVDVPRLVLQLDVVPQLRIPARPCTIRPSLTAITGEPCFAKIRPLLDGSEADRHRRVRPTHPLLANRPTASSAYFDGAATGKCPCTNPVNAPIN